MNEIFTANELSKIFDKSIHFGVQNLKTSSKDIKDGDLFIAIKGENVDGHDFVKEALDKGAVLAIVEKKLSGIDENRQIIVDSYQSALKKLAKFAVTRANSKIIGLTGSVGKTTTKDMLKHLLSKQENFKNSVHASEKNLNSQIGLPISAARTSANTKISIFEMGMSAHGEIKNLIEIAPPKISLITTVCETHLKFFDSIFDIAKAKSEIFETTVPQEFAVIPQDSPYADFLKEKAEKCGIKKIFSFGFAHDADIRILSYEFLDEGFKVFVNFVGEEVLYYLPCNNIAAIPNSAAAIFTAHLASDVSCKELAAAMETFSPTHGRGELIHLQKKNILVIDDSYNACPTSVRAAIQSMGRYKNRRKILILGDMRELGQGEVNFHRGLSPAIDKFGIDIVYTCGNLAKKLFDNLREEKKGQWFENSVQAASEISNLVQDGDCILIKGSRFMKMELIVEALKNL